MENILSGDGKYAYKVQEFMETKFGAKKALLTTSGTSALELASYALDFKQERQGDCSVLYFLFNCECNFTCRSKTGLCRYPRRTWLGTFNVL
nr:hypothetical protein [Methanosarcina sp. WWM596]